MDTGSRSDGSRTIEEQQAEIARLEQQLDTQLAEYAKMRSRVPVSGRNAGKYQGYVSSCLARIVESGNLGYPKEARGRLYGSVQVIFSVQRSGALEGVKINKSSGHAVLDQAIVKAIETSAPFAPFPSTFDKYLEVLAITQTFQFGRKGDNVEP